MLRQRELKRLSSLLVGRELVSKKRTGCKGQPARNRSLLWKTAENIRRLVMIHDETLPLSLSLPNTNAPVEIVHNATQVLDQCVLFRLDHRY